MSDPTPFHSLLFDRPEDGAPEDQPEPSCFHDLHLDQVSAAILAGRDGYALAPFFRTPLRRIRTIQYRHEIFRDLEDAALSMHVASFAAAMRTVRAHLEQSEKAHYALQKQRWFLDAVDLYCRTVAELHARLSETPLQSSGMLAFNGFLSAYLGSAGFASMRHEAHRLVSDLSALQYDLDIEGAEIEVKRHGGAPDYGAEVARTFAKFADGTVRDHRFRFNDYPEMNHVEAAILDRVALLFPQLFADLALYWQRYRRDALDAVVGRFEREVQFYLACGEHMARMRSVGLELCYPEVTDRSKDVRAEAMFDLALADTLVARRPAQSGRKPLVTNDFHLAGPERILVVSGANQGGKTTFARAFGQLHYLAALGCPVPARAARLSVFDHLFTHFEREETAASLVGKLEDELLRMHQILEAATAHSVLIMNESFGSTTLEDARLLGREVLRRIIEKDMLCVCVTFVDELASLDAATVSMVASVDPSDPAVRTFEIVRQPANGLAYALAIARKYRLTYADVRARIARIPVPLGTAPRSPGESGLGEESRQ